MPATRLGPVAKRNIEKLADAVAALARMHYAARHQGWKVESRANVQTSAGSVLVLAAATTSTVPTDVPSIRLVLTISDGSQPMLEAAALRTLAQKLRIRLLCLAPAQTDPEAGTITLHLNPRSDPPRGEVVS